MRSCQSRLQVVVLLLAAAWAAGAAGGAAALCLGSCAGSGAARRCVFHVRLDVFASNTGYYTVDGCAGVSPTLGMEAGVNYTFDQSHPTNWYHPLGFAYGPDGVYANHTELSPVTPAPGGAACNVSNATLGACQSPWYQLNGTALCAAGGCGEDFGLDAYEDHWFSGKREEWLSAGNFSVELAITDATTWELFYFCHIHQRMGGRIVVLGADGAPRAPPAGSSAAPQALNYAPQSPSAFDAACGTFNVSQYRNGAGCPDMKFLCSNSLDQYGQCMVALDCAMHVEMRVSGARDATVTFMHQMIAHHRNAVNMAKALLRENPPSLHCGTAYNGRRRLDGAAGSGLDDEPCRTPDITGNEPVVDMLWNIINGQNHQITFMENWLRDNDQPAFDYCPHAKPFPVTLVVVSVCSVSLVALLIGVGYCFFVKGKPEGVTTPQVTAEPGSAPDSARPQSPVEGGAGLPKAEALVTA